MRKRKKLQPSLFREAEVAKGKNKLLRMNLILVLIERFSVVLRHANRYLSGC